MKKLMKIGEKTYLVDMETNVAEEVTAEEPTVEPTEEDTDTSVEDEVKAVMKTLGLTEKFEAIEKAAKETKDPAQKKFVEMLDINGEQKAKSEMTSDEVIVKYFRAIATNDNVTVKALSEGTDADGGYLVPNDFSQELLRELANNPYMRNEVKVIKMKRLTLDISTLATRPVVTWVAENTAITESQPTFGTDAIIARKMAAITPISNELIEDAMDVDMVKLIVSLFAEAIGEAEDAAIINGNGTTAPRGIVTAYEADATPLVPAAGAFSFDKLLPLINALPQKYKKNAKLYMSQTTIDFLSALKDTTGKYLWEPNVTAGELPKLKGFPVMQQDDLNATDIIFGDLKKAYWLGDRREFTIKISDTAGDSFSKDQVAVRVTNRIAGDVVDFNALRFMNTVVYV